FETKSTLREGSLRISAAINIPPLSLILEKAEPRCDGSDRDRLFSGLNTGVEPVRKKGFTVIQRDNSFSITAMVLSGYGQGRRWSVATVECASVQTKPLTSMKEVASPQGLRLNPSSRKHASSQANFLPELRLRRTPKLLPSQS